MVERFPKSLNLPGGLGTALKPAWESIICARKPYGQNEITAMIGSQLDELEAMWRAQAPALITPTGAAAGSSAVTGMSVSESAAATFLNTVMSWRNCLAEICSQPNTSTTETKSGTTTDLRILLCCLSEITRASTTPAQTSPDGLRSLVSAADNLFACAVLASRAIRELFAIENATGATLTEHQDAAVPARLAFEPIVVARKPLSGTVAANVQQWGTGALNIDGCRVDSGKHGSRSLGVTTAGRWPPNVVLDDAAAAELDRQSGYLVSGSRKAAEYGLMGYHGADPAPMPEVTGDSGGASRFFPVFKHDQKCVFSGMLSGCEDVPTATRKSLKTVEPQSIAVRDASENRSPSSAAKQESSPTPVDTAKTNSSTTQAAIDSSAQQNATQNRSASNDLHALYAEILCASCGTAIAQSVAATQQGHSGSRELGLPSTGDFNEQILIHNLARFAEDLENLDTTSTTTVLMTSLGCVVDAINMYTTRVSQQGKRKSEETSQGLPGLSWPVKYQAKAPQTQRPSVDGTAHPTCKPLDLMRWLIRLVTPPGGTVLDPFAGSGTTGEAAIHEHKRAILIEREPDYLPLIVARLHKPRQVGFDFDESTP